MKYCKLCLDPTTRPNSKFNKDGVCFACENFNKEINGYDEIDRAIVIDKLVKKYCSQKGNSFDCIIGISGGKDSADKHIGKMIKFKRYWFLHLST